MANREEFELAFKLLIGHEGIWSNDPRDPGNWTGPGSTGELRGTKYGISARAYPNFVDIKNLTLARAHDIYFADYWLRAGCPHMPPRLAYVVFDASVNNGVSRAVRWLQEAVGTAGDGAFGPQTVNAMTRAVTRDQEHVIVEVMAHRLRFMAELSTWRTFRGGWSRRLVRLPYEAAHHFEPRVIA